MQRWFAASIVSLPLPLARLQGCARLGDAFCTRLGPLGAVDPAHEVLAIERRQGLEQAACCGRGAQSSSDVLRHGAELWTFGCKHNHNLHAVSDGSIAAPRRPELEDE